MLVFVHSIHLGFTNLDLVEFPTQLLQKKLTILRLFLTRQYLLWRRSKVKKVYDFKAIGRWICTRFQSRFWPFYL
jgi:hypothetical protein